MTVISQPSATGQKLDKMFVKHNKENNVAPVKTPKQVLRKYDSDYIEISELWGQCANVGKFCES